MLGSPTKRAPSASHYPLLRGGGMASGMPNARARNKASSGRRKQTVMGGLCKQLLGCPTLGLPSEKCLLGPLGPGSRWAPKVFCLQ